MSKSTIENILKQIDELPPVEQQRMHYLLNDRLHKPGKPPLDRRVPPLPMPDSTYEFQWLKEHARQYAGQWVALDGNRLIAHGTEHDPVWAAAQADGAYLPLVTLVEDPDAPPFIGL